MLIDNKNLFPLAYINESLYGYYMDADGEVWSTRQKTIKKLMGSTSSYGYARGNLSKNYTLNNSSWNANALFNQALAHSDFIKETYDPQKKQPGGYGPKVLSAKALGVDLDKVKPPIAPIDRSHAGSVSEGIAAKGWIICSHLPDVGLVFSKQPAIHLTVESAKSEMERLAREVPGTKFVLMRILNTIVSGGVTWA